MARELELEIDKGIRKLEIVTKQLVTSNFVGSYKSAFKGRGLEFDGYREYAPGDDAALIDWRATVRSGNKVLVKEFVEERNLEVFFLVDSSQTMVFGTHDRLKDEFAAELTASLAYAMLQSGDSVGMAMFAEEVKTHLPPTIGRKQYYVILKTLASAERYGGEKRLAAAIEYANATLDRGSLLIIISDFIGGRGDWETQLKIASRKFDVIGMMVRDPRDLELPTGVGEVVLADPYSDEQVLIDVDKVRDEYNREAKAQAEAVEEAFVKAGGDLLMLRTDQAFDEPVIKFFKRRAARVR